jgi:hypothetical protein
MRKEVEDIVKAEGWTKVSIEKMRKVDSFAKESQRFGIGAGRFKLFQTSINER